MWHGPCPWPESTEDNEDRRVHPIQHATFILIIGRTLCRNLSGQGLYLVVVTILAKLLTGWVE